MRNSRLACVRTPHRLFSFLHFFGFHRFRAVEQLDERHGRVVANTETELQDTEVAARTVRETRTEHVEQLRDGVTIAQAVERQTTVCERRLLAERDEGLDNIAQLLRLRQRRLDDFVIDERVGHVTDNCQTVAAPAAQFPQTLTVTHFNFLDSKF